MVAKTEINPFLPKNRYSSMRDRNSTPALFSHLKPPFPGFLSSQELGKRGDFDMSISFDKTSFGCQ